MYLSTSHWRTRWCDGRRFPYTVDPDHMCGFASISNTQGSLVNMERSVGTVQRVLMLESPLSRDHLVMLRHASVAS